MLKRLYAGDAVCWVHCVLLMVRIASSQNQMPAVSSFSIVRTYYAYALHALRWQPEPPSVTWPRSWVGLA